jgi:hypothetical protein
METVTISRKTLEFLTLKTAEMYSWDGLDLTIEEDRQVAIHIDEAVEVLALQVEMDEMREKRQEELRRHYEEHHAAQAAKESN